MCITSTGLDEAEGWTTDPEVEGRVKTEGLGLYIGA